MWEISNSRQLINFLISLLFGVGYGIYYAVFKAIRRVLRHSALGVFIEDIIFFFTSGVITFLLMLSLSVGEIRFYILLGILIGFCAFYFILAEPVSLGFAFIIKAIRLSFLTFSAFFRRIFRFIGKVATKLAYFCKEKSKKMQ